MPDKTSDPGNHSTAKRFLPSSMNSIENKNSEKRPKHTQSYIKEKCMEISNDATQNNFTKLMEGVAFTLSGFVNPERSALRDQALEMGGEYQPDWNPTCTLLICAFHNTPKFKQVERENGTIVSKEWIFECYNKKKLVEIELYLMHAGKPWRRSAELNQSDKVQGIALLEEPKERAGKGALVMTGSPSSKGGLSSSRKVCALPSEIKEWAADDLNKTISWLESQDDKPEATEIRAVASKGIITCLQDAIDSLKQNKNIKAVTEQWMFVPHIVTHLAELEDAFSHGSLTKKELYKYADSCKNIYYIELKILSNHADFKTCKKEDFKKGDAELVDEGFDSDQTIEMTEEEIEFASNQLGF